MSLNKIFKIVAVIIILFIPIKIYSITVNNIGTKSSNFTYSYIKSAAIKSQSYDYPLTITQSMSLQITATLTPISETLTDKNLHLYLTQGGSVKYNLSYTLNQSEGSFSVTYKTDYLQPGTYTITSDSYGTKEQLEIGIVGILKGDTFDGAISLGQFL